MVRIGIPEWMFLSDVYVSTAIDVMLADPQYRERIVRDWKQTVEHAVGDRELFEAEAHTYAARMACENMCGHKVQNPFPGWTGNWIQWLKSEMESAGT